MRLVTSTAATIGVIATGLTLCACSSNSSTAPSASTSASASATGSTAGTTAAASTSATTAAQGGPSTSTTSQNAQASSCKSSDLSFALGTKSGGSGQMTQVVELTNRGSSACTMDGFPGVDLVGAANGQQNYAWSLVRSSARYSEVTLQPGGTAHFDLMYLPETAGGSAGINVFKLVITPPNTYTQADVTWNQPVVLQDGATHPGTFISPVASGS